MTQFGLYINGIRNACGQSMREISERTGISETALQKLEDGSRAASKDQLFRLARCFDASEKEFLRISQASRVAVEATIAHGHQHPVRRSPSFFRNNPLSHIRIDNLRRDLNTLETRPLNVKFSMPPPELRPFIDSIVFCKGHNLGHPFESTLPDGTAHLQIVVGDGGREVVKGMAMQSQRFERAWVMGINSKPVTYKLYDEGGAIYVRFRPAGLYAFTKINQDALADQTVDATMVFGSSVGRLWETVAALDHPDQMIAEVEQFFLDKLNAVAVKPDMLTYMLDHIGLPLTQLASKTGYSDKYLTKTFQKYVGVGPKTFQRILRFHDSICDLNQLSMKVDWADVVFRHNYYDQAHFIKEFKHFSGFTPQNYLSLATSCARYLHTPFPPGHR